MFTDAQMLAHPSCSSCLNSCANCSGRLHSTTFAAAWPSLPGALLLPPSLSPPAETSVRSMTPRAQGSPSGYSERAKIRLELLPHGAGAAAWLSSTAAAPAEASGCQWRAPCNSMSLGHQSPAQVGSWRTPQRYGRQATGPCQLVTVRWSGMVRPCLPHLVASCDAHLSRPQHTARGCSAALLPAAAPESLPAPAAQEWWEKPAGSGWASLLAAATVRTRAGWVAQHSYTAAGDSPLARQLTPPSAFHPPGPCTGWWDSGGSRVGGHDRAPRAARHPATLLGCCALQALCPAGRGAPR